LAEEQGAKLQGCRAKSGAIQKKWLTVRVAEANVKRSRFRVQCLSVLLSCPTFSNQSESCMPFKHVRSHTPCIPFKHVRSHTPCMPFTLHAIQTCEKSHALHAIQTCESDLSCKYTQK
jgi:hypothetical protein